MSKATDARRDINVFPSIVRAARPQPEPEVFIGRSRQLLPISVVLHGCEICPSAPRRNMAQRRMFVAMKEQVIGVQRDLRIEEVRTLRSSPDIVKSKSNVALMRN